MVAIVVLINIYRRPFTIRDYAAEVSAGVTKRLKHENPSDIDQSIAVWTLTIKRVAERHNMSQEDLTAKIKEWVDGTMFDRRSSKEDHGLAAYLKKNFDDAANSYREALQLEKDHYASLERESAASNDKLFELSTKVGDSDFAAARLLEALAAYQESLQYVSVHSLKWAEGKANTGIAHREYGERETDATATGHLTQAVKDFKDALGVYSNTSPVAWAETMNNLGSAFVDLAVRSKSEIAGKVFNDAIQTHQEALKVFKKKDRPEEWADTVNGIGFAIVKYTEQYHVTDELELLTTVMNDQREAIRILANNHSSYDLAESQLDLGLVLIRVSELNTNSDKSDLKEAVELLNCAQTFFTRTKSPYNWARIQNRLGLAMNDLADEEDGKGKIPLLEESIGAYTQAADPEIKSLHPDFWAMIEYNLGLALASRAKESDAQTATSYYARAIQAFRNSLEVYTPDLFPRWYAKAEKHLGSALYQTGILNSASGLSSLAESENAYRAALEYYTKDQFPDDYAELKVNIGNTLYERSVQTTGTNSEAIAAAAARQYEDALAIYNETNSPDDWAETKEDLGDALYAQGKHSDGKESLRLFSQAESAFKDAMRKQSEEDRVAVFVKLGRALFDHAAIAPAEQAKQLRHQGISAYRNAADNDDAGAANSLAWKLATSGDREIRDGLAAVRYAKKAVALSNSPIYIDTLAAAYAEASQFVEAVDAEGQAINMLPPHDQRRDVWSMRLKVYSNHLAYHERE